MLVQPNSKQNFSSNRSSFAIHSFLISGFIQITASISTTRMQILHNSIAPHNSGRRNRPILEIQPLEIKTKTNSVDRIENRTNLYTFSSRNKTMQSVLFINFIRSFFMIISPCSRLLTSSSNSHVNILLQRTLQLGNTSYTRLRSMYHMIDVFSKSRCRSSYTNIYRVAMRLWFVILLGAPLCSSIVIRINPVVVIKYTRNDTNTTDPKPDTPPGVTKQTVTLLNTNSSSGTFLVDKRYGSNLFWWYFASERNSSADPLIIWLQGQPNTSSLYGLFDEHGPFAIDRRNKSIVKRDHRWTKEFNVLYLDLYTSCGYSYSAHPKGYSTRLEDVGKNLIRALRLFFKTYPEVLKNDLYLSGESMSSKYIFVLAHAILKSNPMMPIKMNLKGVLVGNGFMDAMQLSKYDENLFQIGILPLKTYDQMYEQLPSIDSNILAGNYNEAIMLWRESYYAAIREAGYESMYDVRDVNAFWNSLVPEVATSAPIRQLLGVGNRTFAGPHHCAYFIGEVFRPMASILAEILNHCKVLFYTGQFDILVPYIHTATFLDNLDWEGVSGFFSSRHTPWMMDGTLVGYWKTHRSLSHVLIRNAGHMVGASQPKYLFEMLKKFVNDEVSDPKRFKREDQIE